MAPTKKDGPSRRSSAAAAAKSPPRIETTTPESLPPRPAGSGDPLKPAIEALVATAMREHLTHTDTYARLVALNDLVQ